MDIRIIRWAALAGFVGQVAFVLSWLIAAFWQGRGYSPLEDTISDMYAVTAPRGLFLVVALTLCGILLALSIYGLGDALSPFEREACRLADPGCTESDQVANAGGALDAALSTIGVLKRTPGWQGWSDPRAGSVSSSSC